MRLVSIHLENYRRYRRLDIEFPDGVLGIIGPNGSGKSTLTEAVAWTLYGGKPDILRAGKDSLKWSGAGKGEDVRAVLCFNIDGLEYSLDRTLGGASLSQGGILLANGVRDVEQAVINLLRMDFQEFSASVYTRQKELDVLSRSSPQNRRRLIHRLMGITLVEEAQGLARKDKSYMEERRGEASERLNRNGVDQLSSARKESKAASVLLDDVELRMKKASDEFVATSKRLEDIEARITGMEEQRGTFQNISKKLAVADEKLRMEKRNVSILQDKISKLEARRGEMKELQRLEEEYGRVRKTIEEMDIVKGHWEGMQRINITMEKLGVEKASVEEQLGSLGDVPARIRELEGSKANVKERIAVLVEELNGTISLEGEARQEFRTLENDIREREEHILRIEKLGDAGVCPTCERPLEGHHPLLMEKYREQQTSDGVLRDGLVEKLEILVERKAELRRRIDALEGENKGYDRELKKLTEVSERGRLMRKRLSEIDLEIGCLQNERKSIGAVDYDAREHAVLRKRKRELEASHDVFVKLAVEMEKLPSLSEEMESRVLSINGLEEERKLLSAELATMGFSPEAYASARGERSDVASARETLRSSVSVMEAEKARLLERGESLARRISDLEEDQARVDGLGRDITYLQKLAGSRSSDPSVFGSFLLELTSRILPVLRTHSSELFNSITENRYNGMNVDENYAVTIRDPAAGELPVSRFSGGEEDAANLCLRLAISRALNERSDSLMEFVILDEVFGSQDAVRRENVLRTLGSLSGVFRQVFLITHIEDIKDHVSYVLRVVENSDGSSTVVVE